MSRRPEHRPPARRRTRVLALAVAVLTAIGLVGLTACTPAPEPTVSASVTASSSPAPTPTPAPTAPAGPVLVPEGSAADNLPLFSAVTAAVWATPGNVSGRAYVDALVTAGFEKTAMQVTFDETTVGNPAESIQFSVHWQQECLIGQVGPATGAPVTVVVPALSGGSCLVGSTRPIDW